MTGTLYPSTRNSYHMPMGLPLLKPTADIAQLTAPGATFEDSIANIPHLLGIGAAPESAPLILICCGKRKLSHRARAEDLYASPRAKLSTQLARTLGSPFWIVSAKHNLIGPDEVLEPYDFPLHEYDEQGLMTWKSGLKNALFKVTNGNRRRLVVLGPGSYAREIRESLIEAGFEVAAPIAGLPASLQLSWLKKANQAARRFRDIQALYKLLEAGRAEGRISPLSEILKTAELPTKGVYIFIDPDEPSHFTPTLGRVVRIGTHAVSEGSRATLRNRLRTHRGTEAGIGNHRSSVFRLHVGAALMRQTRKYRRIETWGVEKAYDVQTMKQERSLEEAVSSYIGRLHVAVIPIEDAATKLSLRRYVEKNLIALFTEDGIILDPPGTAWLGNLSLKPAIKASGLWNVSDAFSVYDPKAMSLIRLA